MKVQDLTAGEAIANPTGGPAPVFITSTHPHPRYPSLTLVVWWLPADGRYSFDALSPQQDVGDPISGSEEERAERWWAAIRGVQPEQGAR